MHCHYCCHNCDFNHNYLYHYYFKEKTRNIRTPELKITLLNLFISTKLSEMNTSKLFWSDFFLFSIFFLFLWWRGNFEKFTKDITDHVYNYGQMFQLKLHCITILCFIKRFFKNWIFLCNLVEYLWIYICS